MRQNNNDSFNTSYKSIFKITIPLILVSLSSYLMLSIDRIVLSTVNADMMNAVSMSSTFINIFTIFFAEIIEKNCVVTSQYYGDKQNEKVATCVWQMIFLSLFLIPISLGMASLSTKIHNLPTNLVIYGIPYQQIIFSSSSLYFIYVSLSTFFGTQGKTYIISISVALGCFVNVFFSILFVKFLNFGTLGTAYGTVLGYISQILFLGIIFFNRKNNEIFKTRSISWDFSLLKKIFKLGLPIGILNSGAMTVWFLIMDIVSKISQNQLTLFTLIIVINLFFTYTSNAVMQSISVISANLIAKDDLKEIKNVLKKFLSIIFILFCTLLIFIFLFKQFIFNLIFSIDPGIKNIQDLVCFCIYALIPWGTLIFTYKLLQGICMSGGDTKFVSKVNALIIVFVDFLPILLLNYLGLLHSIWPIVIIFLSEPIPFLIIYILRFKSLKWYKKIV